MDAGGARIDNANFKADGETLVGGSAGTNTAVAPTPSISRRAMSSISSSMAPESVPPMPATYSWTFIRLMEADAGLALLANIYLAPLDRLMADHGYRMVRYADDFVILCRAREEALAALDIVRAWTDKAGLKLHPAKTHVGDCRLPGQGFEFLGYRFEAGRVSCARRASPS
jgi:hypothetical protein